MTTTRLSVNINQETREAIKRIVAEEETTITEVIRRAVGTYAFVRDEAKQHRFMRMTDSPCRCSPATDIHLL